MYKTFTYDRLYKAQRKKCFYCGCGMTSKSWREDNKQGWTRDHFMPYSKGHSLVGNVVLACAKCNREKSDIQPGYVLVQRFIQLYTTTFPSFFDKYKHEWVAEFTETQSLLNSILAWVGRPNIAGIEL
jgi:hypothetical protein